MQDVASQHTTEENGNEPPMTLLAVNERYWLYKGKALLNDMLFGRGAYPFKVKCYVFENSYDLRRFTGEGAATDGMWYINPDIIDRLRKDNLLIEIFSTDDQV
jgi:hypothetical protein